MPRGRPRKGEGAIIKSAELLGWALGGLEREILLTRERLAALRAEADRLRKKLGQRRTEVMSGKTAPVRRRKRRGMSAAARKRMSERMTRRWAEWRKKNKKTE
jgi:hypothetical protein